MKYILPLILFSIQSVFCQFAFNYQDIKLKNTPESSYVVTQTENGNVKRITEYDNKNRLIFEFRETEIPPYFKKQWKTPHRFISGYEYGINDRIIKKFDFNSNAGLTIFIYEYNNSLKTTIELKYLDTNEPKKNTNPYSNIERIKSFSDLTQSKETKNILSSKRTIRYVEKLNENGEPIEIFENSRIFGDSIVTRINYKEKGKELVKKVIGLTSNELKREVNNDYSIENSVKTEIINYRNKKKTSTYRFAESKNPIDKSETSFSERNGLLTIRHYTFDANNYPIKIFVYETSFDGELIIPISDELRKTAEMEYIYNKEGLIVKEKMTNYKTGNKESRKYKYEIETKK
ncbi:hypothetical protein ACIGCP_19645 [Cellulophaga baltica]|uniref:hypothetical protein n=1 Tax=Cellulophaga baltica TaxID=76594 RepID=UPI0037CC2493